MPGFDAVGTSADGRYLYGISSAGNAVVSYDTVNATSVGVVNGFGGATTLAGLSGLAVRPAGSSDSLYALVPASRSVTVARRRSDSTLTLEGGFTDASLAGATALTWSTPAGRLYTAAGRNVRRYGLAGDLPTLFGLVSVAAPAAVTALAVDAAGRLYAAGGGLLTVYNSDLKTPVTLSGLPNATAVLANGNRVSLAGSDGSVTVLHWNAGFTALSVETTFRQGVGGVTGLTGVAVVNNTLWVSSRSGPGGFAPLTITAPGVNAQLIALQTGLTRSRP